MMTSGKFVIAAMLQVQSNHQGRVGSGAKENGRTLRGTAETKMTCKAGSAGAALVKGQGDKAGHMVSHSNDHLAIVTPVLACATAAT